MWEKKKQKKYERENVWIFFLQTEVSVSGTDRLKHDVRALSRNLITNLGAEK